MRSTRDGRPQPLDVVLGGLPDDVVRIPMLPAWFVAGPGGCFVIGDLRTAGDPQRVALDIAATINRVRTAMAASLSWAPFVDALAVGSARQVQRGVNGVTAVEAGDLANVVLDGACPVDADELARIALVAAALSYEPSEEDPSVDGRMEPCAPSSPPTASNSPSTTSEEPTMRRRRFSSLMRTASTDSSGLRSRAG
ncbi:MAG: hypothetical protein AB7L13_11395 [Acidimicrobiia bacterium]